MFGSFNVLIAMRHFLILTVKKKQSRLGTHAHRKRVNKLTDEQVMKGLECCKNLDCQHCEMKSETMGNMNECLYTNAENALDLINRQNTLIESMQENIKCVMSANVRLINQVGKAKSEAIKEFAEKLKEYYPSIADGIDYTAEEMLKD